MATTRQNLDIQSDLVMTEPTVQDRMLLKDAASVQTLYLDFDEPAAADRTVNFEDPGANDTVAYLNKAQVFQNKQISTTPSAGDDITNKTYVDTQVASGTPTATSGSGGGTEGKLTMDEDKGLLIVGGVAELKVDNTTIQFNGSGQIEVVGGVIPDATSGSGGGTKGQITADADKGLEITTGILEIKVDGTTIQFNGSGELEFISGSGGGGPTGVVSSEPQFTEDITGISPPANGTTGGGDISTLDFEANLLEGTRFAFSVPDDYFSGDLTLSVVQAMSSASGAGSIEITTQAKIVDVSAGVIDSLSYPQTQASLTVPTTTDVERRAFLTIADGDFASGDTIQVLYRRVGNDVGDVHAGDQQVLSFQFAYTAVVDSRIATRQTKFFENAPGETATTPNTISGGDISVEDFLTAADNGLRFDFIVPDNWDQISNAEIRFTYVMSASDAAGVVRLETRAKLARVVSGSIDTISPANFDFTPGAGAATVPKQTTSVMSISASSMSKGDAITAIAVRRGTAGADTHTGNFQLICAVITFGTIATTGVSAVTIREEYLNQGIFGNASGAGVNGDTNFADLGGDFETFDNLSSTVASGSLDVSYEGRLGGLQTAIKQIRFFIKGTGTSPQYTLNVYAEGTGLVHTDGPNAAPVGATEIVKTDVDLSAQPTGTKRFFVVLTADIDASEAVLVSRPFVRLE